jgi:hypothetical protein
MFANVIESLHKATEANLHFQQEMYKKFTNLWPGVPTPGASAEETKKLQKKWAAFVSDVLKRQEEYINTQFKAGLSNIEKAFEIGEVKNFEELRAKTLELWQQCFESLKEAYEGQIHDCQKALGKWFDFVSKDGA